MVFFSDTESIREKNVLLHLQDCHKEIRIKILTQKNRMFDFFVPVGKFVFVL